MHRLRPRDLALLSLFIAIQIILTRLCSIPTPVVRFDFNFLAMSLCAAVFGPFWGGVAAAVADFIGVSLFPVVGAYFPGFTLSTFLMGYTYGFFLYKKEKSYRNIALAVFTVMLLFSLGLDTVWVMMLTGKGFIALLPVRLLKCAIMIPVQIILIRLTWNSVGARIYDGVNNDGQA